MTTNRSGIEIVSEDPEVMALQAMIKGLRHIEVKNLSPKHLHVLSAVELFIKLGKKPPTVAQIAFMARMDVEDFEVELTQLVGNGYLHEVMPMFGDLIMTYKMGAKGGTALRHILDRKGKRRVTKGEPTSSSTP